MEKLFKKGDKVIVTLDGMNDSHNSEKVSHYLGVYNLGKWRVTTFTIEGTIQLHENATLGISCSYALSLNDKIVGYVYNTALELALNELYVTHIWDGRLGKWLASRGLILLTDAKASLVVDGIYSVYWSDGVTALYKGEIK